jgi:hypothetical protein
VRWARQVLDLLGSWRSSPGRGRRRRRRRSGGVRVSAQAAIDAIRRGVLAYSAVG